MRLNPQDSRLMHLLLSTLLRHESFLQELCNWCAELHTCASLAAAVASCHQRICVPTNVGTFCSFANALSIKSKFCAVSVVTAHLLPPARVVLGLEPLLELFLESWLLLSLAQLPQPCISSKSAHTPGPCYACNLVVASPDLKIFSRSKVFVEQQS